MISHTPLKRRPHAADYDRHSAIRVSLPLPPSANNMFVNIKGKGRVRSENYRSWARTAGWLIKAQRPHKFDVPVRIGIEVNHPRGLGFDIDNRIKAILDLLVTHEIIVNDSARWVRGVQIEVVDPGAECTVIVEPANG